VRQQASRKDTNVVFALRLHATPEARVMVWRRIATRWPANQDPLRPAVQKAERSRVDVMAQDASSPKRTATKKQ
jgi:hypothetical protein